MKKYKTLKVEKKGAICLLTLNRPDKMNALSLEMINELNHFFGVIADDYQIRVIIFRGAGRAFCAGADLEQANESAYLGITDKTNKM
jgi:enoyl-CoA hydratase/carnithine racemase